MPRAGDGTFQNVPGTTVSPNTTIQSAWANAFSADVQTTFNTAWPVSLGGTGGISPVSGLDALTVRGTSIAAAGTVNLATATGRLVHITGTGTITSFGTAAAGVERELVFDSTPTITYNATSMILPGALSIVAAAGDTAIVVSEGSGNWRFIDYARSSGSPLNPTAPSYATTVTAAGTTTLTVSSSQNQYFTGTTTQTVTLPVVSTLVLGQSFRVVNNSTGRITVQSSGANTIQVMGGMGTEIVLTCIAITGTSSASWDAVYSPPNTPWVQYTPTYTGFGTPANSRIWSRRVGDSLEMRGSSASGVPTAVEAQITLGFNGANGGLTVDATKVVNVQVAGPVMTGAASVSGSFVALIDGGQGYIKFGFSGSGSGGLTAITGSSFAANSQVTSLYAVIPITNW